MFNRNIKFNNLTWFTGKNGIGNMSGIEVTRFDSGNIGLAPYTSRGKIARCDMVIDKDSVDDLIRVLNELKNYI